MKQLLILLFAFILICMLAVTARASLQVSLWNSLGSFRGNPWAVATLYDAYFGFVTFFCWVAWRERSLWVKIAWFVLIMALGNMAMAAYVLLQLFGLGAQEGVDGLFRQKVS